MKDMASFTSKCKTTYHARSISLPSRSHPLTQCVDEHLYRLRSSSEATSSSTSSSSIKHNLAGLKDLQESVHALLQLPLTQQVLAQERSDKCVMEVLEGSLMMLEVMSTTMDVLNQTKERAQDLQSALRRRRGGQHQHQHGFENEVALYMTARKQVNKVIQKCLGEVKRIENKRAFSTLFEKDHNLVAVVSMLREVEAITCSILVSLLSFVSGASRSKSPGWCLVSKLMQIRRVADGADTCEMDKVDIVLSELVSHKSCKANEAMYASNAQKQLQALELSIKALDAPLECVYKTLVKTRVSLLNILSQ